MEKLNEILSETLKVSIEIAEENLGMDDVDYWDSLTHMGLIVAIENEFGIELTGDDIADMTSCDAIRTIVTKYIK